MTALSLKWAYDLGGYSLEPAQPAKPGRGRSTIAGEGELSATIVRNGDALFEYDACKIPATYERLAKVKDDASALHFVENFGFLDRINATRCQVTSILHTAAIVRDLIGKRDAGDWAGLRQWLTDYPDVIRLSAVLVPGSPLGLFFRPRTLADAIFVKFFEDVAHNVEHRHCARPGCENWFRVGLPNGLRATALYCSPNCQKSHAYSKRKESKS